MRRETIALITATLVVFGQSAPLLARGGRGSVSASSRSGGSYSRSGNTASYTSQSGNVSGSKSVSQTSSGYNIDKSVQTQSGASKSTSRDVNTEDRSVERSSTATNAWGESASRERTVKDEGGYASVEGSARTSTGREAEGEGVAGRNAYGQPAYAGTVNTKYNGTYATAGARNPYGGWTTATAGPYGGKVTTTLPSGYRTSTYYGRPYYSYGGAYYRPYTYGGVHYYYPVPPPYYSYYYSPPPGAVILMIAGVKYLMSQDGSYSKETTNSEGKVVYQTVPAPEGARIKTLPAERVLLTVSGTTYYLYSNTFYRRVMEGAQESFVVVTPPAGVVFVAALPADFEVVQFNTMYFSAKGQYYVPYLATDGKELYVMVDRPPQPTGQTAAAAPSTKPGSPAQAAPPVAAPGAPAAATATKAAPPAQPAAASAAPAVRTVAQALHVPAGTLLLVRLATDLSSASAQVGYRFQGFLDQDLAADGRLIAPRGNRVYGVVITVEPASLGATLTDLQVGSQVVALKTQPFTVKGKPAVVKAQSPQAFTLAVPVDVDIMTSVAVR
jgi:hypothetical protein